MPPAVSARLFLRYIRTRSMTDYSELLQVLGLLRVLSCKTQHFRSIKAAATLSPPAELLTQVGLLTTKWIPACFVLLQSLFEMRLTFIQANTCPSSSLCMFQLL